jgi:hypothetical protein
MLLVSRVCQTVKRYVHRDTAAGAQVEIPFDSRADIIGPAAQPRPVLRQLVGAYCHSTFATITRVSEFPAHSVPFVSLSR